MTDDRFVSKAERAEAKTQPPDEVLFAEPPSPVLWAQVYNNGSKVGFVWMTEQPLAKPRAGIVLDDDTFDAPFQDDLGDLSLRMRFDEQADANDWLEHLAETRTGIGGTLNVGPVRHSESLTAARIANRRSK